MSKTRPDAVWIPSNFATGPNEDERKASVVDVAESLLECGPLELAWCHPQTGYYFCTRDHKDTENFPTTHRQAGQPRYHWKPAPHGGIKLGYLMGGQ